ncbi:glycosyltransferase family 2 protein [Agaribacterium sp. ZY112]|uniref:glycosyltransferase family 2 protein n=1 Tax=Agaribacterium sp. ZY112 TaxID=3233574 RepID=UPI003525ED3F
MSELKPCVIIPVFNHGRVIAAIAESLVVKGLPVILLNDGSEPVCARELERVGDKHETVILLSFDSNRGKGAVVCDGLNYAFEKGFTHALQVDADGQHNLDDVAAFLDMMQKCPSAVISGWRPYSDLPKGRRYGRMFTDMWVCIHTLSRDIKDSMCGYRLYPLAQTCQLLAKHRISKRMDFDTDILVRLYWQGLLVKHVPTHISYGEDMPSHFALLADNVRITYMHTRLFLGMLWRLPSLFLRKIHDADALNNRSDNGCSS